MAVDRPITLVLGCGQSGEKWAQDQNIFRDRLILGVDRDQSLGKSGSALSADVFNLPFASGSIDKVHADFILNPLWPDKVSVKETMEDPEVLSSSRFPPEVNAWFCNTLSYSKDQARGNFEYIRWLMRQKAIKETWRVLKPEGVVEVLDHEHIIRWVEQKAEPFFDNHTEGVKLEVQPIKTADLLRSGSLVKVMGKGYSPRKVTLSKVPKPGVLRN